jgi:hypothetical protein
LKKLNHALSNHIGTHGLAPHPGLLPDIEEILKDPPPPTFPLEDYEIEFVRMVSACLSPLKSANSCG